MACLQSALSQWIDEKGPSAFDFGHYGPDSAGLHPTRAASGSGLVQIDGLLQKLLDVSASGKVDDVPLRDALREALAARPSVTLGGRSMTEALQVIYASIRCALAHCRRLKQQPGKWRQAPVLCVCALCV